MDRDAIETAVRSISQVGTASVTDAELTIYIDEGYNEVVSHTDWSWCYALTPQTVAMVVDTSKYALNAAVKRILGVIDVSDRVSLESVSQADWVSRQEALESTSRPRIFTFSRQQLHIWPVPATTDNLDIYYYEHPEFAAAGATVPVFDSAFHMILVDWALHRVWEQEEDNEKSDDYRARFEARLGRMVQFDNTQIGDVPKIYGQRGHGGLGSNMPWLADAANGGAG